jgi:hypothetical protein
MVWVVRYIKETNKRMPFNKHITSGAIMQQQKGTKELINESVTQKAFSGSRIGHYEGSGRRIYVLAIVTSNNFI